MGGGGDGGSVVLVDVIVDMFVAANVVEVEVMVEVMVVIETAKLGRMATIADKSDSTQS